MDNENYIYLLFLNLIMKSSLVKSYKEIKKICDMLKQNGAAEETLHSLKRDFIRRRIENFKIYKDKHDRSISPVDKSAIIICDRDHYPKDLVEDAIKTILKTKSFNLHSFADKYRIDTSALLAIKLFSRLLEPKPKQKKQNVRRDKGVEIMETGIPGIQYYISDAKSRHPKFIKDGVRFTPADVEHLTKSKARILLEIVRDNIVPYGEISAWSTYYSFDPKISKPFRTHFKELVDEIFSIGSKPRKTFAKPVVYTEEPVEKQTDKSSAETINVELRSYFSNDAEYEQFTAFANERNLKLETPEKIERAIDAFITHEHTAAEGKNDVKFLTDESAVETTPYTSFIITKYSFAVPRKYIEDMIEEHGWSMKYAEDVIIFLVDGLRLFTKKQSVGSRYFSGDCVQNNFKRNSQKNDMRNLKRIIRNLKSYGVILVWKAKKNTPISLNPHISEYSSKSLANLVAFLLDESRKRNNNKE